MKIVVLDGYTENPGDISWGPIEALGEVTVYDRTAYEESPLIAERIGDADVIVINTCCFIHDAKEESIQNILEMAEYKKSGVEPIALKAVITGNNIFWTAERTQKELLREHLFMSNIYKSNM